jgi:hypothetical protein
MSTITFTVQTVDQSNAAIVRGAQVSFLGRNYRTDSNGSVSLWFQSVLLGSDAMLVVLASGYSELRQSIALVESLSTSPYTASLVRTGGRVPVKILDGVSKAPIAGAQVYIDQQPVQSTDSNGTLEIILADGVHTIRVRKDGYDEGFTTFTSFSSSVTPVTVELQSPANASFPLTLSFEPSNGSPAPTQGAEVTVTSGLKTGTFVTDASGTIVTDHVFSPGESVSISATKDGWQNFSQIIIVKDPTPYSFSLQKSDVQPSEQDPNPALAGGGDLTPVNDSGVIPTFYTSNPVEWKAPDTYEWTYPSNEFGRYFTTTQARMYVGNVFMDELNTVQYALQANRVPIYGYASRDFDAVGTGKALVQGQIVINFISDGYLYTLLKEYDKFRIQKLVENDKDAADDARFNSLYQQKAALIQELTAKPGTVVNPQGAVALTGYTGRTQANITADIAKVDEELRQIAARRGSNLDGSTRQLTSFKQPLNAFPNAVYLPIAFDIDIELEGAGRKVKRKLEECYLGANEQIMDQSGNALLDTYSFIARRLR